MSKSFQRYGAVFAIAFILVGMCFTQKVHALTWTGQWISYHNSETIPMFRREFTVSKPLSSATAYVCGLGQHEFRINGQKVGNNVMEPLWTTYSKKCFYVTYDVTSLLAQGNNAMGVLLGNGFYNVDTTSTTPRYAKLNTAPAVKKMTMMLQLNFTDGTTATIVSDSSWRAYKSPITFSSIYGGEDYDARQDQQGWDSPGFNATSWEAATQCVSPAGTLMAQYGQPVQVRHVYTASKVTALTGGAYEYDLTQNIAGVPVLQVRGQAGQTIKLSFREEFSTYTQSPNNNVYCKYTLKGTGTELWYPRFFYYGFRFVKVEGASLTADTMYNANVALNKPVTTSSSYVGGGWTGANAVDGQTTSSTASMGWSSNSNLTANHTESILLSLGSQYQIHEVDLYPRNDNGNAGNGFPVNFTIQMSTDSINWTTVVTQTAYPLPSSGAVQPFAFTAQNAKFVKVQGTSLRTNPNDNNSYRMQLAEINVVSDQTTTLPVILSVQGNEINSVTRTGSFTCSDTLWNKEHYIIDKAIEGNMQAVATDCPHREKLGWLEESHLVGPSIMYNYEVAEFYRKIFDDMKDAQLTNGMVPDIAPEYTVFSGGFRDSPEWGSALVIGPWQVYQVYGDTSILSNNYDAMKVYVNYLTSKSSGYLLNYGLGDWYGIDLSVTNMTRLVASAIYYYDAVIMQQVATLLNKTADITTWATLASNIKAAFNNTLFTASTSTYLTGNQTTCGMPLALGLVPDANKAALLAKLVARVQSDGYRMQVGEIGFRFVLKALSDNNRSDVIAQIAAQTTSPSYGYLANSGRTTLSEAMDGNSSSSQFHMMYGHIEEWFYYAALGIAPNKPGYAEIRFKPEVVGTLKSATGYVQTKNGKTSSSWLFANKIFDQDIVIPPGSIGLVYLPSAGSGIDSAMVYAGNTVVWQNKAVAGTVAGITFDTSANNYLIWHVAAGTYHFRVGPPNTSAPVTQTITAPARLTTYFSVVCMGQKYSVDIKDVHGIRIFDVKGNMVYRLPVASGAAGINWNGRSAGGLPISRGIYVMQLLGNGVNKTIKLNIR